MKPAYAVIWSEAAAADLKGIIEYVAADSVPNACRFFEEIKRKASSLHTFPERGRIVPELQDQGLTQYREVIVSPWRIIYRISRKSVYVLSVLDSRRNVEDILLTRLVHSKQ